MKFKEKSPPREFKIGFENQITIKDCGTVLLKIDEQLTFVTEDRKEYDVARKNWGFYATPSMNGRLKKFGFKTALVKNSHGMYYIMLVEKNRINEFQNYLKEEKQSIEQWRDEK